jgi:hypothetical protein
MMTFHFRHLASFTAASTDPLKQWWAVQAKSSKVEKYWIHFLSPSCGCSRKVFDYLEARGEQSHNVPLNKNEILFLIGEPDDKATIKMKLRAEKFGYQVRIHSPKEPLPISGVPSLLVIDGTSIQYNGGYSPKRIFSKDDVQFKHLESKILSGEKIQVWPTWGCAVSEELQSILKPEKQIEQLLSQIYQGDQ